MVGVDIFLGDSTTQANGRVVRKMLTVSKLSLFVKANFTPRSISTCMKRFSGHETTIGEGKLFWEKTGSGPHNIFLLPGALGSTRTDFSPQLNDLDKSAFTVYAWDPPGYGKSRPPDRSWPDKFFNRDASQAVQLIHSIGITSRSV